ncbi:MAG: hypothetical protein LM587_01920 [Candidatus Aenigmarchaeota archaeon]|nr:hypothetical protein [Candidatus Aenigmarchaeota archaeon]
MADLPTFVIIIVAIVAAGLLFYAFAHRFGAGTAKVTSQECEQQVKVACSNLKGTGDISAFKDVSSACIQQLGISSFYFDECKEGDRDVCFQICTTVETEAGLP